MEYDFIKYHEIKSYCSAFVRAWVMSVVFLNPQVKQEFYLRMNIFKNEYFIFSHELLLGLCQNIHRQTQNSQNLYFSSQDLHLLCMIIFIIELKVDAWPVSKHT